MKFINRNLNYQVLGSYDLPVNEEANRLCEQTLTTDQLNSLTSLQLVLKEDFPDHVRNTVSLIRFLKARKFDVPKAEYMYRERMQWVSDYKPHMINKKDVENELKLGAFFWHGTDVNNRPILFFKAKRFFPIKDDHKHEKIWRYFVYIVEQGMKTLPLPPYDQVVVVNDREGATTTNNDLAGFRRLVKAGDYYPEILGSFITVYPNHLFKLVITVIKPFLDVTTQKKLNMISQKDPKVIASELVAKYGFSRERVAELLEEHGGQTKIDAAVSKLMQAEEESVLSHALDQISLDESLHSTNMNIRVTSQS